MQVIGIILILISVGTVVGPVGAVAIIYRNDLSQRSNYSPNPRHYQW